MDDTGSSPVALRKQQSHTVKAKDIWKYAHMMDLDVIAEEHVLVTARGVLRGPPPGLGPVGVRFSLLAPFGCAVGGLGLGRSGRNH